MGSENVCRDSLAVIPTYNEALNLEALVHRVLDVGAFDVLVVDDNSPDGTGEIADRLAKQFPGRVTVLHRSQKLGLGSAYIQGFSYALKAGYQRIFEMDADFSHNPDDLPALRDALNHFDMVLGSRYTAGGGTRHWPLWRQIISRGGSTYARLVLGLPFHDVTGGFKGFRSSALKALDLKKIASNGYSFQIEMTYQCYQRGFHIVEIPILFEDRRSGQSKMSWAIFKEALFLVWKLRLGQSALREAPQ